MQSTTTIPQIATAPTGRLPHIVAALAPVPPGHPAWCRTDHTNGDNPGWCQGATAEAPAPVQFADATPGADPSLVLAARITQVNDQPEIFGINTRLWVDVDTETLELDVEQTDQLIGQLEGFLPKLRALRAQLAEVSAGDIPADLVAKAAWLATPIVPIADRA